MQELLDHEKLDFIDVATSSHNHTDHLDADTLTPLIKANPWLKLVIPEANRALALAACSTCAEASLALVFFLPIKRFVRLALSPG